MRLTSVIILVFNTFLCYNVVRLYCHRCNSTSPNPTFFSPVHFHILMHEYGIPLWDFSMPRQVNVDEIYKYIVVQYLISVHTIYTVFYFLKCYWWYHQPCQKQLGPSEKKINRPCKRSCECKIRVNQWTNESHFVVFCYSFIMVHFNHNPWVN